MRPSLLALLAVLVASQAHATPEVIIKQDDAHEARSLDGVVMLGVLFSQYTHLGVAAWYGHPLVPQGFIPNLNEALFLEAGAAFEHYSWGFCDWSWNRVTPMAGARWQFYVTPEISLYATAKLGYAIGFSESYACAAPGSVDTSGLIPDVSLGGYWNVSEAWRVRVDLGSYGMAAGLGTHL